MYSVHMALNSFLKDTRMFYWTDSYTALCWIRTCYIELMKYKRNTLDRERKNNSKEGFAMICRRYERKPVPMPPTPQLPDG